MISELTYEPFAFDGDKRVLHVAPGQKSDLQRVADAAGVRLEWITGSSAIQEYSDTREPDFNSPSSWILIVESVEDAGKLQAALDLE
ncbi:hypothetical protein [Stenotrophomonas maltophilia]|uniref:hypothetical protein n=1 Tax=Stenotrophomonas maltophilia TaxID=40324 RepID=UPI0013DD49DD|nr:hypothetical protein [Stenotrophomonas maltophilia]